MTEPRITASVRFFVATLALALLAGATARAQDTGAGAMVRLGFLAGSWSCTIKGGVSNGLVQDVEYSFSPDGIWMTEKSHDRGSYDDYALQVWGFDVKANKLIAVQFVAAGAFTKSVQGWAGDRFVSHRDDNGATVSVKSTGKSSMQWTIESADRTSIVTEDCTRPV